MRRTCGPSGDSRSTRAHGTTASMRRSRHRRHLAAALRMDPSLPRDYNWEESVLIQHELRRAVSLAAGYYRRQFYNLRWTNNVLVDPDLDYTAFTFTGPRDSRLPNGGGEVITLYNLNPAKLGQIDQVITVSTTNRRVYDGF